MQEWFAKFTLYLGVKYTYLRNLGQVQANLECSFNVAGVVFKKKTDGEGLVLLWTFPVLRCDWGKNFSNQSIPNLSPFAVFAQTPPPAYIYFKESAHDFCFHLANEKINLFDKPWRTQPKWDPP